MYNDGKCYLWVPSSLTLSVLTAQAAATINAVHTALNQAYGLTKKANYQAGETHEYYLPLNDLDMGGAPFTRDATPGMACCGPIENMAYLGVDYASLIVAFGGEIEALPVWFELDSLTGEVPSTFPNRTYTDEQNVEHIHTWQTWGVWGQSHHPVQYGGKWYREAIYGESGTRLLASQWVNQVASVKTMKDYQAIVASN